MKLATLNTWKNDGDYLRRCDAMAVLLSTMQADVVLLQEVLSIPDSSTHTARFLQSTCHYSSIADAPSRGKIRIVEGTQHFCHSGLAILSRFPIIESRILPLPSSSQGGERIALLAAIKSPTGPLVIGNIHLSHVRSESDLRKQQWHTAILAPHESWPGIPLILGGDLNCDLDASDCELQPPARYHSHDLFLLAPKRTGHATHPVPVVPGRKERRIDGLFAIAKMGEDLPFRATHGHVAANVMLPDAPCLPSDHALVLVELEPVSRQSTPGVASNHPDHDLGGSLCNSPQSEFIPET